MISALLCWLWLWRDKSRLATGTEVQQMWTHVHFLPCSVLWTALVHEQVHKLTVWRGEKKASLLCCSLHTMGLNTNFSPCIPRFICGLLPYNTFWRVTGSPASASLHQLLSLGSMCLPHFFFSTSNCQKDTVIARASNARKKKKQ